MKASARQTTVLRVVHVCFKLLFEIIGELITFLPACPQVLIYVNVYFIIQFS